jgi:hypothetical protein
MGAQKCEELVKWVTANNGCVSPDVELAWTPHQGQYFHSRKTLEASDNPICSCPHALSLSHLNVLSQSPVPVHDCSNDSICAALVGKVPASTIRYFFLAEQRLKCEKSFWWSYINALPKEEDMTTPLWFDEEDLLWLAGTTLHTSVEDPSKSAVMARKEMWVNEWNLGRRVLREAGHDVEPYTWYDVFAHKGSL